GSTRGSRWWSRSSGRRRSANCSPSRTRAGPCASWCRSARVVRVAEGGGPMSATSLTRRTPWCFHEDGPVEAPFEVEAAREDFPGLCGEVRPDVPLVYLDSAATALKPLPVIRAVQGYDAEDTANVHRGLYTLSERATEAYESARLRVARFLGADDPARVVFTHGTTESINLVAHSWGETFLKPGDEVLLTLLEHHSNLVPWQMLARR